VYDVLHYFRKVAGNFTTIPQYFKEHGYITAGMGKIFHSGIASGFQDPISWTEPYFDKDDEHWRFAEQYSWYAVDDAETLKYPLPDHLIAQHAKQTLERLAPKARTGEQPFFVAVGFRRPHLPWVFPKSFLNFYPMDRIRLPKNPFASVNLPEYAWSNFAEIRVYQDIARHFGFGAINSTYPDEVVLKLRRAYYSTVSFVDSLVGEVVKTLNDLGLADNTVISFLGDHGFQVS
jgi:iduronate 2-sulfatase